MEICSMCSIELKYRPQKVVRKLSSLGGPTFKKNDSDQLVLNLAVDKSYFQVEVMKNKTSESWWHIGFSSLLGQNWYCSIDSNFDQAEADIEPGAAG